MTETKHTLGPFGVSKHATPDYAPQYGIYDEATGRDVCIVKGPESLANLFATAPDLMEACQAVQEWFLDHGPPLGDSESAHRERMIRAQLRAAIAKARGE